MTLCIAWRDHEGNVHLASDSRITIGQSTEDVAVKVTRLQCEVFPPSSDLKSGTATYSIDLGIAFAGSHLNAYVIKESLVEVLSRLQHIPGKTPVSMDRIAKIAFWAYQSLSKKVCGIPSLGKSGICALFITGYCPDKQKIRAYKLSTSANNQCNFSEVIHDLGDVEMLGSGEGPGKSSNHYPHDPVSILLEVIDDTAAPSVGGALQYARHVGTTLNVYAAWQLSDEVRYLRGGLDINEFISSSAHDDLFIAPLIFDPRPNVYLNESQDD